MTRGQAWIGVVGLLGACWHEEPLIDDTFTEEEWTFLSTEFALPGPQLCPPGVDLASCTSRADFGKLLFFDPSLSGPIRVDDPSAPGPVGVAGQVSCASCHDQDNFFVDTRSQPGNVSVGATRTKHNAMSPINVAYKAAVAEKNCQRDDADPTCGFVFSWTGKYATPGEVLNIAGRNAMNSHGEEMSAALRANPQYLMSYVGLFGGFPPPCKPFEMPCHRANRPDPDDPPDDTPNVFDNLSLVFDAYVRQLNSVGSPFDCYVASPIEGGRTTANCEGFDDAERRGLSVFIGKGMCVECHRGPLLSDLAFHNTGVSQIGPNVPPLDRGFGGELGDSNYRDGQFLTPPLRHVAMTAPYMHAGQYGSLSEVIDFYRRGGDREGFLGIKDARIEPLEITDDEARDLEAFLRSLTGSTESLELWSPPTVAP